MIGGVRVPLLELGVHNRAGDLTPCRVQVAVSTEVSGDTVAQSRRCLGEPEYVDVGTAHSRQYQVGEPACCVGHEDGIDGNVLAEYFRHQQVGASRISA